MTEPFLNKAPSHWQLLDGIPHPVWLLDAAGHAEYLNSTGRESLAGAATLPANLVWSRVVHPEDVWQLQHEWSPRGASRPAFDRTIRLRQASGEYRVCQLHAVMMDDMWMLTCTAKPVAHLVHLAPAAAERGQVPISQPGGEVENGVPPDISPTSHDAAELRRSEARYRALIEAISEMVWRADTEGRAIPISGGEKLLGENRTPTFEEWLERIHPDDREQAIRTWEVGRAAGQVVTTRYRVQRADGSWRHVVNRAVPVRNAAGAVEEWVGALVDVTAECEAGLALERMVDELETARQRPNQDHALLQSLIHNAPVGIAFVDTEFRVLSANPAIASILGVSDRRRAIGERLPDLLPESWARVGGIMQEVRDTGIPRFNVAVSVESPAGSGHIQHRLCSFYPVQSHAQVIGLGIVLLDVTRQKETERVLEEERRFLELVLESVDDGILVCNAQGQLIKVNKSSLRFLGVETPPLLQVGEWLDHSCILRLDGTPMPLEELPLYRALHGETVTGEELLIQPEDGPQRLILVRGRPIAGQDSQPLGAVIVTQDITEKRELESRMHQIQKMDAIGQLAGGVAHDFNNLLTVVTGASEMLLARLSHDPDASHLVREIALAGERATTLTSQLLAFGRRSVIAPRVLAVNDLVRDTERMLRRLVGEDIEVVTELALELPNVLVDASQLTQILLNLAVNARDAMPNGGRLAIRTTLCEVDTGHAATHPDVAPGSHVVISVSDNGMGMTPETQRRIFEPFFTTKAAGKGTGLGLAMVYGIVQQAGGHVGVTTELGGGTTFEIFLPETREEVRAIASIPVEPNQGGSETILLVEDEPAVRLLARQALAARGYNVIMAADGQEALMLAELLHQQLDLLITDVIMPGIGGLLLSQRLRARQPSLRVLYMSGYANDAMDRNGLLADGVELLPKPFTPTELARRVRQFLDRPTS